jgi:hypothetical protein
MDAVSVAVAAVDVALVASVCDARFPKRGMMILHVSVNDRWQAIKIGA